MKTSSLPRAAGILMHISSLPGDFSIGGFGPETLRFIDRIAECGFTYWQVLPFTTIDECNSPYKSFSAFAGNPYLISPELLYEEGLLTKEELDGARQHQPYSCEYERLSRERPALLRKAAKRASAEKKEKIAAFIEGHPHIAKFCEFMALKSANGQKPWYEWTTDAFDPDDLYLWQFIETVFFEQWADVRAYANKKGVKIIGDIPIYVAHDSCDVWANPELFDLDETGFPRSVAGCPPDYFAKDGQFWGNPLYDWDKMKKDGYAWWQDRIRNMMVLFDGVRIDHFRGLSSYWSIPADAATAKEGHWEKGPGLEFVEVLKSAAGEKGLIIAEDLGEITPDVVELVEQSGLPGMRVLQFAFPGTPDSPHLPHQYIHNCVAYTGTHDNNTLLGHVWEIDDASRKRLLAYCGFTEEKWDCPESYDAIIRTMYASSADLFILPVQDVLHYGEDTRMNRPGTASGNWAFRLTQEQLDAIDRKKYRDLAELYGRA